MKNAKRILISIAIPLLIAASTSSCAAPVDEKTLVTQAKQAEDSQKWQEAIDKSQQAIKANEQNIEARRILADSYYETQQYQKCIDECRWMIKSALIKDAAVLQEVFLQAGLAYMEMGNLEQADIWIEDALEIETGSFNPQLYGAYGDLLIKTKRYNEAVQALDQAIALDKTKPRLFCLRGIAKGARGNISDASVDFDYANSLAPGDVEIATSYAQFLESQEQYRQALYVLALMKESNPQANAQTVHDRIWQKALAQAKADLQKRPDAPVPIVYVAFLHMDKNDVASAKSELNKAFQKHGELVPLAWRLKGDLASLDGNYKEAITDYDKAFEAFHAKKGGRDLGTEITKLHQKRAKEKLASH